MIICSAQQVSKMFGGHLVFENISLDIHENDRIGLVGRNGSGKTTIFKLLTGSETTDAGSIHFKKGLKVGYLAQIPVFPDEMTVRDVLWTAFSSLVDMQTAMKKMEVDMASGISEKELERSLEKYGVLQEQFGLQGGYEIESNITKVSSGLEIVELLNQSFSSLSGGEKTKVGLALILLQHPDLLLLDEPTNHLDITAIEWLGQFLKEYNGTMIVISHDRYFLDEVITKVIDLEDGEVTVFHQNYSGFVKEKEERLLVEFQAYEEQQKKIKKMKEAIKRLKEWANQANPPNEGLHRRARNMERALERIEKLKRPILERKKIGLQFESANRSGNDVIVVENLTKAFDRPLFEQINMLIEYKDTAAIVGRNGTGKSTLLKLILGEIPADSGEARLGSSVKLGYLSQHSTVKNPTDTVLQAFREEIAVTEGEARHILAKFLFYGFSVYRQVGQLSGGERMRLRLAQLMYKDVNVLILDEPTNHLDIESREVLEDALENFTGTILAVSHDRYFLNKICHKTYWLENKTVTEFIGNYDWARTKMKEQREKEEVVKVKPVERKKIIEKPKQDDSKQIEKIEEALVEVETTIHRLDVQMTEETDVDTLQVLFQEKNQLELQREELYAELEELV